MKEIILHEKTTPAVRVRRTRLHFPNWMVLYINGDKIGAIKEVRDKYRQPDGNHMSLGQAKNLVESFYLEETSDYEDAS